MHSTLVNRKPECLWPGGGVGLEHFEDGGPVQRPRLDEVEECGLCLCLVHAALNVVLSADLAHRHSTGQSLRECLPDQLGVGQVVEGSLRARIGPESIVLASVHTATVAELQLGPDGHQQDCLLFGQWKSVVSNVVQCLVVQ